MVYSIRQQYTADSSITGLSLTGTTARMAASQLLPTALIRAILASLAATAGGPCDTVVTVTTGFAWWFVSYGSNATFKGSNNNKKDRMTKLRPG